MEDHILEIKNIYKHYPGVKALDNISFTIKRNTVHCIIGENGAGKSTFIKILTGAIRRDGGKIYYNSKDYEARSIKEAMQSGMSVLYQELNVVDQLTVEQNLTLGIEETRLGIVKYSERSNKIFEVLKRIAPDISLKQKVSELSVGKKQILEISKAIASEANIIIMDEPTAAISEEEVRKLFSVISNLRKENVTVIYISHRLSEIMEIGEYITVFRDGKVIETKSIAEISSQDDLIRMMLGKMVVQTYLPSKIDFGHKVLEVKKINNSKLRDIQFDLYKGEILGFYGLVGSGKTEIARSIYGVDAREGDILFHNERLPANKPRDVIKKGIAMVPEERRTEGLFTDLSIRENIPYMDMKKITSWGITSLKRERELARKFMSSMKIASKDEEHIVSKLSGGNQQKVVVSKCINSGCSLLLLDEPTRGVDIGAKEEIYTIIRNLSENEGLSVIVFSSELPEVLGLCDRIILLYDGMIKAELKNGPEIDNEKIMRIVTGGNA